MPDIMWPSPLMLSTTCITHGVTRSHIQPSMPLSSPANLQHFHISQTELSLQTHWCVSQSLRAWSLDRIYALHLHLLIRGQSFSHGYVRHSRSLLTPRRLSSRRPLQASGKSTPRAVSVSTGPGRQFSSSIFRRTSTSSSHLAITLPVQLLTPVERTRRLSMLSATSFSTAL